MYLKISIGTSKSSTGSRPYTGPTCNRKFLTERALGKTWQKAADLLVTNWHTGQLMQTCINLLWGNLPGSYFVCNFSSFKALRTQQTANYVSTFVRRDLENPIICSKANWGRKNITFFEVGQIFLAGHFHLWPVAKYHKSGKTPQIVTHSVAFSRKLCLWYMTPFFVQISGQSLRPKSMAVVFWSEWGGHVWSIF